MATPYVNIYNSFLDKVSDPYLADMTDDELSTQLLKFLNNSIPKFKKCKRNLYDRDDILEEFEATLTDEDIEILANLMVIEWLRPQINNLELLKQALSSKDFNITSQANHLKELQVLRKDAQSEISKLLVDYSYNNNSLDDLRDD
jgi:signal recognition particle GTPase